ncbi:MAG TPA: HD domain-containing phosphohydrolase [Pseudomonadales bacterium]|nr:HD domain-containing phosphohydrolase [Pseudomonadales bacterium]
MKLSMNVGLRDRLVMIILIVGIGGEIAKFSYDYLQLDKHLVQQGEQSVSRTLFRVAGVVDQMLTNKNMTDVQWLLETLSIQEEDVHSALVGPNGTIVASTERKFINRPISDYSVMVGSIPEPSVTQESDVSLWAHETGIAGASNICVLDENALRSKTCYRLVHWEGLSDRKASQTAEIMRGVALQMIIITLLSLAVWAGIGSNVVARANAIYDSARRFEKGDLNARSSLDGDDEFTHISQMVDKSYDRLALMIKQIVSAFNTSTLHSDPFTAGHEDRATDLCRQIGRRMALSNMQMEALSVAAQIHDVGQSEVPAEIMLSPKHLSAEEFNFIKMHPVVGADILNNIDFPWPVSDIVLQHHENYDGTGYPSGLCGEEICVEARIIRVADVYESLVSHRPHRDAMTPEAAKRFIGEHSGRYFDPEIVGHLFALLDEGYQLPEVLHIKNLESRPDFVSGELLFLNRDATNVSGSESPSAGFESSEQSDMLLAVERSIAAISKTLEMRDPYTAGHQERVADVSVMIGKSLGLSKYDLEGLRLAAVVHDIGKIKIPISILTKPRRLNEVEYALMKTHPAASYQILKGLDMPWPVADIAHQHHEAWDGSGYPQGLKGEQILLEARILSVADIVESMSASRPYRPALGLDAAVAEIKKQRGLKLDPMVVDAFLACLEAGCWAQDHSSFRRVSVDN